MSRGAPEKRMRTLLRGHGLRCTTSRLAVLSALAATRPAGAHLTVAEIHDRLTQAGHRVDLATVYRTVSTLVELGVVHTLTVDERGATYGLADQPHHHAVCTRCGALIGLPAAQLTTTLAAASAESRFLLSDQAGMTLRGLCPDCRDKAGA
ncbi:MAG: transcriptional repressor [Mycobacteriaceae bacterium]|nr:transcriptional repressor [Mycobacteriaceae bacterium]